VLVPADNPQNGGVLALSGGALNLGQLLRGGSNQVEQLTDVVLQSRTLADSIVARLEVDSVAAEREAEIRRILKQGTEIHKEQGDGLTISVSGHDPELVTRIANLLPQLANRVMTQLSMQAALRRADFLEAQLDRASDRLTASQQAMVRFQTSQSAPELEEQAKRTLDVAVTLQQQILDQEIRIADMRRASTPNNPELQAAAAKLAGMKAQLSQLTSGTQGASPVLLSLNTSPELQATATRMLRDYTKDEQVYTALTAALAQAQVDAKNDLPVLTVLDPARLPKGPDGPGLVVLLGLALLVGLVIGSIAAFTREYIRNARRDAENADFFLAWDQMKVDVTRGLPGFSESPGERRSQER
jgi:capsule polysaccharide export protein KpsE/RkpR